ncbi:MAG: IS3 family transposase [Parvimonas sp.]|nr:IS3 family transposase [Parvimonas sp.]
MRHRGRVGFLLFNRIITLFDENIDESKSLEIFHPIYTWKRTSYENYTLRPMLKKIFEGGKLVYDLPGIEEIRKYCKQEMFYGENYSSYEKLIEDIKEYIKWYNTKRIKENLKGMYPIDYRLHSFE